MARAERKGLAVDPARRRPRRAIRPPVRRFVAAVGAGWALVLIPFLWILTDLWTGGPSLLRTVLPGGQLGNFYDLQARAMFHGHLSVADGALGQEAFIRGGHQYTYFGLFPSLLRMPVLAFTSRLDGRLTAMSVLVAWVVTGVLLALLLWRTHVVLNDSPGLSRLQMVMYATIFASMMGGSVLLMLAANPWVYTEDIAWSIALMIGVMFTLMGVIEAPTRARIICTGVLILGASLTRGSTGYGCVLGGLTATLLLMGRRRRNGGPRWWLGMALASLLPLTVSLAVSWAKFRVIDGYPLSDQVYYTSHHLNLINHGHYFSLAYLPSGIFNYLLSPGIHLGLTFPFITLPQFPAHAFGNVPLFGSEEVTSVPGSMPLLFILSCWGVIALVGRRRGSGTRATYPSLVVGAAPAVALLGFGFIDNRFVGDLFPFFAVAACIGIVDGVARLSGRARPVRKGAVAVVAALALFGLAANVGMSVTPTGWWGQTQVTNFVHAQKVAGDVIGTPLSSVAKRARHLPVSAPVNSLYVIGDCQALYLRPSTGILSWLVVGAPAQQHALCQSLTGH